MAVLKLYMKSGNVIKLSNVTKWEVEGANGIKRLAITRKDFGQERLITPSVDITQIEAITETTYWWDRLSS